MGKSAEAEIKLFCFTADIEFGQLRKILTWWKDEWLQIDQPAASDKQKIGAWNPRPWLAYRLEDLMIVIQMTGSQKDQEQYPDLGSNCEIYFDPDMLESEFLSAWQTLSTGESVSHSEV